jgi:hypothetical protein
MNKTIYANNNMIFSENHYVKTERGVLMAKELKKGDIIDDFGKAIKITKICEYKTLRYIDTAFNGNFGLDEIRKIVKRKDNNSFYEIHLLNSGKKLYACRYHCFLTDKDDAKHIYNLKSGDKIWIDISAFSSDGSLK